MDSLAKKLGQFSVGPIAGALIGLITVPVITYFISPEEYGKSSMFTLAITILQMFVFLGMDQAYVKRFYQAKDKIRLLTNAISPSAFLVLILEIVLFIFKEEVAFLLFDDRKELLCVYALMAIVPALAIEKFGMLTIRMAQRGLAYSLMTILLKLLTLVFTIGLLLVYERSFRSIVWGTVIAQILYAILLLLIQESIFKIKLSTIDFGEIKSLLRFGLPIVPTAVIGWVLSGMDKVMLRAMCDYSELGMYEVALKVVMALSIIQSCFTNFWVPVAHQWNTEGVPKENFIKVGKLITFTMTAVFMLLLLFKEVIFMILSDEYVEGVDIIPFLLIYPVMYTISEVTVMGVYFKEKTINLLIVSVVAAGTNVVLNWFLIPVLGAIGAAIATGVSYTIFFWCRTIISRRLWFKFPLGDYIMVTAVLFIISFVNIIVNNWTIYVINAVALAGLVLYFRKEVGTILNIGVRLLKSKK